MGGGRVGGWSEAQEMWTQELTLAGVAACMQARRILLRQGYRFATRLEANEVRAWA